MGGEPASEDVTRVEAVRAHAMQIRRNVVRMAAGKGEGYVGQGLDVADILAVLFCSELRYDPADRSPRSTASSSRRAITRSACGRRSPKPAIWTASTSTLTAPTEQT